MKVLIDGIEYVKAPAKCENPQLLDFRFECSDLNGEVSIREYLHELLKTLWSEGGEFSGKRPFGNSGWEYDLYFALVKANSVAGLLNDDGDLEEVDKEAANQIIFGLISEMCLGQS